MASKKIQLYTDRANTIEASPETSANCVILSDGNDLQKVLNNDLTTPTVVHEESSFKTGVGDIDVSSSVVDGEVGRMVIKGKTYQNILPEPSTHVLTNNKEMFKVNEGLDPNVEIVDGVSKSAILTGQTLVNWCTSGTTLVTFSSSYRMFNLISPNRTPLQQNKDYLIIVDVLSLKTPVTTLGLRLQIGNSYITIATKTGLIKCKFNTGDNQNLNGNNLRLYTTAEDSADETFQCSFKNVMIIEYQEGMENWDIPYFEGMQSVKLPVLKTTGKNLFDGEGLYAAVQAGQATGGLELLINGLKIKKNTKYSISFKYETDTDRPVSSYCVLSKINQSLDNHNELYVFNQNNSSNGNSLNTRSLQFNSGDFEYLYLSASSITPTTDGYISYSDIQVEEGSTATPFEPYKSNILTVNEDVTLRGIGDVKDTLDLMTGEVIERISSFKPTNAWSISNELENTVLFTIKPPQDMDLSSTIISDKLPSVSPDGGGIWDTDIEGIGFITRGDLIRVRLLKTKASTLQEFQNYLQSNPITIQYKLATESIKTVDLSSSGNWEKVVLDGSEDMVEYLSGNFVYYSYGNSSITNVLPYASGGRAFANHTLTGSTGVSNLVTNYKYIVAPKTTGTTGLCFSLDGSMTVEEAKTFLSQNPITVWYQTATHQGSTQVKQPIFFADGHVQLSSGTDNSLIPTLDYQAKTSNSYVMDLMKANTRYTMKAKSASGNFTLGGSSYSLGTNRVFSTTGAEFNANNMMVITGSYEDLMILEGELTSKTIPYFKDIKSAFEGEDKIEVLSTGKNLYSHGDSAFTPERDGWYFINGDRETLFGDKVHKDCGQGAWFYLEGGRYYFNVVGNDNVKTLQVVGEKERLYGSGATIPKGWYALRMRVQNANQEVSITNVMVEKDTETNYEPYKSNSTKIPLLSPLRSLPNGVCDELIVDRMKKKVTLIQRVGYGVLGRQGHGYNYANSSINTNLYQPWYTKDLGDNVANSTNANTMLCDKLLVTYENYTGRAKESIGMYPDKSANFTGCLLKTTLGAKTVKQWFEANEVSVYYQLETPVVTEIDLENFPLVYKDGHIFLNSEIAPMVEINYNVNQSQQIQANNETLQRHELDILDLDNLIVSFVNAEYNLRLLKFNMELSMMALAE